ncbi:MAG TPA: monofunctional biosynthetic peptidoglycan transglycosylase [Thermodesulfobacteriota bacterium]
MVAKGVSRRPGRRPGRSVVGRWLRRAVVAALIAAAIAVWLLWPALTADVDRLATRWPDTLPKDRRPPVWTPLDRIDPKLRWAVIAAEDANFWRHGGIDWDATVAAARYNLEVGRYAVGGSTLTQQLAKNLFLSREKTLLRKAREAILAWRLERALTKRRILELYLNVAEWGDGIFGAEAAARHHLGHSAARMTWGEAATLAAILPSPTNKLDPDRAPGRVRRRRAIVLNHLYRANRLSRAELFEARAAPLTAAEARAAAAAEAREAAARAAARPPAPAATPAIRPAVGPSGSDPAGAAEDRAVGRALFEPVAPPPPEAPAP